MSTLKRTRAGSEGGVSRSPSPSAPNKRIRYNSYDLDAYPSAVRNRYPRYRAMYFQATSPGHSSGSSHYTSTRSNSLYKGYSRRDGSPISLPPLRVPTPRSVPIAKPKASPYTYMTASHFLTRLECCITSDPYHPLPEPPCAPATPVELPPIRTTHNRGLPVSLASLLEPPPSSGTPPATHSASTMSSHRTPQTPRAARSGDKAVAQAQPAPSSPALQDELSPIRRQLALIQRRLDDFATECAAAGPSSQPILNSPSAFVHASSPSTASSTLAALTAVRTDLREALGDLDDARFSLSRQRNEAHMQAMLAEARFEQLNGTEARLQTSQETQQRLRKERDEARMETEVLRRQMEDYRIQADRYRSERDVYRNDREKVRSQRDKYQIERDDARLYGDSMRGMGQRLTGENEWLRGENQVLKHEKEVLTDERRVWREEKGILQGEHRELREAVSELRGQNDMLREESRDLREDNEGLRAEVLRMRSAARAARGEEAEEGADQDVLASGVPRRSVSNTIRPSPPGVSRPPSPDLPRQSPPEAPTLDAPPMVYQPISSSKALPPLAEGMPQLASAVRRTRIRLVTFPEAAVSQIPPPPPFIKEEDPW